MPYSNLQPGQIDALLLRAREENRDACVLERLTWIQHFLQNSKSVQETAAYFGITTTTLRRWIKRFNPEDLSSLEERSHTPKQLRSSNVAPEVITLIRNYREADPLMGKERIAVLLQQEYGIALSASTVGRIITREKLYFGATPLHWKKRAPQDAVAPRTTHNTDTLSHVSEIATPVAATPVHTAEASSPSKHVPQCSCFVCRMHRVDWSSVRGVLRITALLMNIALVGFFLMTMYLESSAAHEAPHYATQDASIIEVRLPNLDGLSPNSVIQP